MTSLEEFNSFYLPLLHLRNMRENSIELQDLVTELDYQVHELGMHHLSALTPLLEKVEIKTNEGIKLAKSFTPQNERCLKFYSEFCKGLSLFQNKILNSLQDIRPSLQEEEESIVELMNFIQESKQTYLALSQVEIPQVEIPSLASLSQRIHSATLDLLSFGKRTMNIAMLHPRVLVASGLGFVWRNYLCEYYEYVTDDPEACPSELTYWDVAKSLALPSIGILCVLLSSFRVSSPEKRKQSVSIEERKKIELWIDQMTLHLPKETKDRLIIDLLHNNNTVASAGTTSSYYCIKFQEKFDKNLDQLKGVLAHELGHIVNDDVCLKKNLQDLVIYILLPATLQPLIDSLGQGSLMYISLIIEILIGKFKKIRETTDVNQRFIAVLSLIFSLFLDISIPHCLLGLGYYCAVIRERERKADAFAGENCDEEGLKGLIDFFKRDPISLKLQKIITPEFQKYIVEALLKTRWGWTHPADSERIANVQLQLQQRFPKTEEELQEHIKIEYEAFLKTINRDLHMRFQHDLEVEG